MRSYPNDAYHIGIICALPKELMAVRAMLDEEHRPLQSKDAQDYNSYVLGRIGEHNVVAAGLPAGVYGTTSATLVGQDMLWTFPQLRIGLMVGIGGGVPNIKAKRDIRLGDIVVSQPNTTNGGVVQYDLGKLLGNGQFELKGSLNKPPQTLLTALTNLQASLHQSTIAQYLQEVDKKYPSLRKKGYVYPGSNQDRLYCTRCDPSRWWWILWILVTWLWPLWRCSDCDNGQVRRVSRSNTTPFVHYGTIASANTLLENAKKRDHIGREIEALCVEMRAAGLMDNFPCLVIRGICDYADAYKNDTWQEWAALTAAAYAKELLEYVSPQTTMAERPIREILVIQREDDRTCLYSYLGSFRSLHAPLQRTDCLVLDPIDRHLQLQEEHNIEQRAHNRRQEAFNQRRETYKHNKQYQNGHRAFDVANYEDHKQRNQIAVDGTCRWVLKHEQYQRWLSPDADGLLWVSADPGCGKSVLSRSLVDKYLPLTFDTSITICYFFFKDNDEQDGLATALCAILHQIFSHQPELIRHALAVLKKKRPDNLQKDRHELWRILQSAANDTDAQPVICVLDALDECKDGDRGLLVDFLCQFYEGSQSRVRRKNSWLKWLVTSRPHDDIQENFSQLPSYMPPIRLRGEDVNDQLRKEIDLVITARIVELSSKLKLSEMKTTEVVQFLRKMENRTYLWLHLVIDDIEMSLKTELITDQTKFSSLPPTVDAAYERILQRIQNTQEKQYARRILTIVVGARRPLTISEMALALGLTAPSKTPKSLADMRINSSDLGDKIRRWCGLFVFINHSRLYLIHQTAKDFLLSRESDFKTSLDSWKHCLHPLKVNEEMAKICVLFLCLSDFESDTPEIFGDDENVESFFYFASEHWADYTRTVETDLDEQTQSCMRALYDMRNERFTRWTHIMWMAKQNFPPEVEMTPVHLASYLGHFHMLKRLLESSPDTIRSGGTDFTAMIYAAEEGHIKVVQMLLDKGVDVNAQNVNGDTALRAASFGGHIEIVRMLLDQGADVNAQSRMYGTALGAASFRGHIEIVQMLLDEDVDVNAQSDTYSSALQVASKKGHIEVVRILLNKGANVNAQSQDDGTALQAASFRGHLEIVQILLNKGANVNTQNGPYGTALRAASDGGHIEVVRILLNQGADVNPRDEYVYTAFQRTPCRDYADLAQLLFDNDANVNTQSGMYGTALQAASEGGHIEVVRILLSKGANVNARSGAFGTALQAASAKGHVETVRMLLDKGADVNNQIGKNSTALQMALEGGHIEVARILLDQGANFHGGNYSAALQAASRHNHKEVE